METRKENVIDKDCQQKTNSYIGSFNGIINTLCNDVQNVIEKINMFKKENQRPKILQNSKNYKYYTQNHFQTKLIKYDEFFQSQNKLKQIRSIIKSIQQDIKNQKYSQKIQQHKIILDLIEKIKNLMKLLEKCQKNINQTKSLDGFELNSKKKCIQHLDELKQPLEKCIDNLMKDKKLEMQKNQEEEFIEIFSNELISIEKCKKDNQIEIKLKKMSQQFETKQKQILKLKQQINSYQKLVQQQQKDKKSKIDKKCNQISQLKYQLAKSEKILAKTKQNIMTQINTLFRLIDFDKTIQYQQPAKIDQKNKSIQKIEDQQLKLNQQLIHVIQHFKQKRTSILKSQFQQHANNLDNLTTSQISSYVQNQNNIQFSNNFYQLMNLVQYLMKKVNSTLKQKIILAKEIHAQQTTLKTIQQSIKKEQQKFQNLKSNVTQLQATTKQKQKNIQNLKKTQQQLHKSFFKTINSNFNQAIQSAKLKQQKINLQKQQKKLTQAVTASQKQINTLQSIIQNIKEQNNINLITITSLNQDKQTLKKQVSTLKQKISQIQTQNQKKTTEIKEITSKSNHLSSSLQLEKSKNQTNLQQIQQLKESVNKLTQQKTALMIENQKFKSQIRNYSKQQQELKQSARKIKNEAQMMEVDLTEKITNLQKLNEQNQTKMKASTDFIVQLNHMIQTQGVQIEGLKEKNKLLENHVMTLQKVQSQKIKLDSQVQQLNSKIKELQNKCNNQQNSQKQKNQIFKRQLQNRENKQKTLTKNIFSLQVMNKKLQQQIQISRQNEQKKSQQLKALMIFSQQRSIQANKTFKQEKERLQSQLTMKDQQIQDLQDDLNVAQNKIIKLEARLSKNGISESRISVDN